MKIKVKAYQKYGKTVEEPELFEFCCWQELYEWLSKPNNLYKCEKCKASMTLKTNKKDGLD